MEKEGIGYVVAAVGDAVGPVAFSSLCASREWLSTDMAKAFMRAYRQSLDYIVSAQASDIGVRLQAAGFFTEIDAQVLADTISAYQSLGCWQIDPIIRQSSYERLLDVFIHSGAITQRHPYQAAIVPPPE